MKPSQLEACKVPWGARPAFHNPTVPPELETEQSLLPLPEQLYSIASLFFKGNQDPMTVGMWRNAKCFKPLVPSRTSCSPAHSGSGAAVQAALLWHWLSVLGAAPSMALHSKSQELLPVLL